MESATIRRLPALPGLIQLGLIALLVLLAAVAWVITSEQMDGMDAGPGTDPGALGFFVGVWVVMMAAMMFPSIAPMVMMHVRIQEGRRERGQAGVAGATALFVGGYLLAWSAAGLIGYGIFQLGKAVTGDLFSWDDAGPYLAGGIVCGAAIYQLTPLKDVCLRHCRSPFAFLMQHWHAGRLGSLRMGVVHGGWCIGCCWALMAALFALGVMSLGWMAFIAALIAVEKLLPWKTLANRGIAVLLLGPGPGDRVHAGQRPGPHPSRVGGGDAGHGQRLDGLDERRWWERRAIAGQPDGLRARSDALEAVRPVVALPGHRLTPIPTVGEREGETMPLYLSRFSYTPETWARLIGNPEDRRKAAQDVHRVGRWEAPRVLVRLRRTRRLQPVGGPRQRVHGRGCAGD